MKTLNTVFQNSPSPTSSRSTAEVPTVEAGVDEVARGPLFGPVYAAAVVLNKEEPLHKYLNDSKKVTKKRRKEVRDWIEKTAIAYGVASVSSAVIDKINIRNAAQLAMELAIRELSSKVRPTRILVDGDYFAGTNAFGKYDILLQNETNKENFTLPPLVTGDEEGNGIEHHTVVGGDAIFANIAAASILAKEYHDDYIKAMVLADPTLHERYEINSNMGYGTAKHISGLKQHGATEHHRRTFLTRILPQEKKDFKKLFTTMDEMVALKEEEDEMERASKAEE